jgi:hypothetical protein
VCGIVVNILLDQDFGGGMERIKNYCLFYGYKGLESSLSILITRNPK